MQRKHTEETRANILAARSSGESITRILEQFGVPRSTIYHWIKMNKNLKLKNGNEVTVREFFELQRDMKKMKEENEILKKAGCTVSSPLKEKLEAISKLDGEYTIHALCRALDVLRSTYYHHKLRKVEETLIEKQDKNFKPIIKQIFDKTKGRVGSKKIRVLMKQDGHQITPKRVARLMKEMGLKTVSRKKKQKYNYDVKAKYRKNVLNREFDQKEANAVWVSDITQVTVNYIPYYFCAVIDLFSRRVIGYSVSNKQNTQLVIEAFEQAYQVREIGKELIFHSDQGCQYTSFSLNLYFKEVGITRSFSKPGCPYDNAVIEAFFRAYKYEEANQYYYKNFDEFKKGVEEYVSFYNNMRPHERLGYLTPIQYEEKEIK